MSAAKKIEGNTKEAKSKFSIVYGDLHANGKRQKRINDFWIFCHSTFWSKEIFSEIQEEEFKKLIAEHFRHSKNSDKTFIELIHRAVLAKRYVKRSQWRYIPKPSDWLNINYSKGLAGTADWFRQLAEQRKTVPSYNSAL